MVYNFTQLFYFLISLIFFFTYIIFSIIFLLYFKEVLRFVV
jgi:hypothetical protein